MLSVKASDKFGATMQFAAEMGLVDQLIGKLEYLSNYANGEGSRYDKALGYDTRCELYGDFAPHSLSFSMMRFDGKEWTFWFAGGLIYQGPDSPADGTSPSLTVSLNSATGWFVHT